MKHFCTAFFIVIMFPFTAPAEFRIATVDINRVINESPESKTLRQELDQKTLEARKKLDARRQTLKNLEDKLKKDNVKPDSKEADKYREQAREFERALKDTDEELKKEFYKSNKTLTEKALTLIKSYSQKNNLSLVLDKSEKTRGPVLFGDSSADVTEDILKMVH